jgi:16S rRNA pseudouridine516 synthase
MLNKPAGIVSAVTDDRDKTVIDHIKDVYPRKDYFPVGRLDKDTEGLLIITNNGQLAHQVLSPKKHIPKKYYVEIDGKIGVEEIEGLEKGVLLEDGYLTKKANAELIESKDDFSSIYLTITEGKFHQVKRMIKSVGFEVSYLKRVAMGSLELDPDLKKGDFRELTESEVALLKGDYNGTD